MKNSLYLFNVLIKEIGLSTQDLSYHDRFVGTRPLCSNSSRIDAEAFLFHALLTHPITSTVSSARVQALYPYLKEYFNALCSTQFNNAEINL